MCFLSNDNLTFTFSHKTLARKKKNYYLCKWGIYNNVTPSYNYMNTNTLRGGLPASNPPFSHDFCPPSGENPCYGCALYSLLGSEQGDSAFVFSHCSNQLSDGQQTAKCCPLVGKELPASALFPWLESGGVRHDWLRQVSALGLLFRAPACKHHLLVVLLFCCLVVTIRLHCGLLFVV